MSVHILNPGDSWTPPAGVTSALIALWSGGGGGGGGNLGSNGGGAGGAEYCAMTGSCTPGTAITPTIGLGGAGATGGNGAQGGASFLFDGDFAISVTGGGNGGGTGTGGNGGSGGLGDTTHDGGAGGASSGSRGGGGGGSATASANGEAGNTAAIGTGGQGQGRGGDGGSVASPNGQNGQVPGGGGGGGMLGAKGGNGGDGQGWVIYAPPTVPTVNGFATTTDGLTITGTLSEIDLYPFSGANAGGFLLHGTAGTVLTWDISGTTLTLHLSDPVRVGQTVTLDYSGAAGITNLNADLAAFLARAVTNNSTVPAPVTSHGPLSYRQFAPWGLFHKMS